MADLYIDAEVFARLRANLAQTRESMQRPGRDLGAIDAAAARGRSPSRSGSGHSVPCSPGSSGRGSLR